MPEPWSVLLHLLVFAYWLGGDIGAFAASFILTDRRQSRDARLAAARLLNLIDMAPRSALILTLPTGITLGVQRGWIDMHSGAFAALWIVSALWLAALWVQHLRHASGALWRGADFVLRVGLIAIAVAGVGFVGPLFLKIKFGCLALATSLGLAIRIAIAPMTPAITTLARVGADPETDGAISKALFVARPIVVCIWLCLLIAAWAGLAKPV